MEAEFEKSKNPEEDERPIEVARRPPEVCPRPTGIMSLRQAAPPPHAWRSAHFDWATNATVALGPLEIKTFELTI